MHRLGAAMVVAAVLAACAPPGQAPDAARPAPAAGQQVEISRAESQVSIAGDDGFVTRRQAQRLPDRYTETLTLDDGALVYQRFAAERAGDDADGRTTILRLLGTPTYRELGLPARPESFRAGRNRYGTFDYAVVDGKELRCVIMDQFFGGSASAAVGAPRNQEFRLTKCRDTADARAAALEADVLEIVGRVSFDGGAMNRARPVNR